MGQLDKLQILTVHGVGLKVGVELGSLTSCSVRHWRCDGVDSLAASEAVGEGGDKQQPRARREHGKFSGGARRQWYERGK
ncbi:UNVERIFIED_CONTAM: hypothetical protein Slati_0841800 [Sesamum latifolium]|uniref:Uncharacterized protein n=1 Tax=Sesamum latifolium TaxID=2727402 RepID=A0AAW2XQI6_9LAMI